MNTAHAQEGLSEAAKKHIDQWILRYPPEQKRSGVFEALRYVQAENDGYLSVPLMKAVAAHLQLPDIAVYEVASFYTMYNLEKVGKHLVQVCTNVSCMLNGSDKIVAHLKQTLGIDFDETTADGRVTLKEVECLGACVKAPVCQIGYTYHENLTPDKLDAILASLTE